MHENEAAERLVRKVPLNETPGLAEGSEYNVRFSSCLPDLFWFAGPKNIGSCRFFRSRGNWKTAVFYIIGARNAGYIYKYL
jgi:hypothetical protein